MSKGFYIISRVCVCVCVCVCHWQRQRDWNLYVGEAVCGGRQCMSLCMYVWRPEVSIRFLYHSPPFFTLIYLHFVCLHYYICYSMQRTMWNKREQLVELGTFLSPCGSWDRTQVAELAANALIHWSISLTSWDQFLKWGSLYMNSRKIGHKYTN